MRGSGCAAGGGPKARPLRRSEARAGPELSDARGQRFARGGKRPLPRELGICCCERSASDGTAGPRDRARVPAETSPGPPPPRGGLVVSRALPTARLPLWGDPHHQHSLSCIRASCSRPQAPLARRRVSLLNTTESFCRRGRAAAPPHSDCTRISTGGRICGSRCVQRNTPRGHTTPRAKPSDTAKHSDQGAQAALDALLRCTALPMSSLAWIREAATRSEAAVDLPPTPALHAATVVTSTAQLALFKACAFGPVAGTCLLVRAQLRRPASCSTS